MKKVIACFAALVAVAICTPGAVAQADGAIAAEGAWVRATAPSARAAAGFVLLRGSELQNDRLIGGTSDFADGLSVHEITVDGGVMKMRPLTDGLAVPAGSVVDLKPGRIHLMFTGLKRPLKAGERVNVTLRFENAGDIALVFTVEPLGSNGPSVKQSQEMWEPVLHPELRKANN